jgi:hypothetical protein
VAWGGGGRGEGEGTLRLSNLRGQRPIQVELEGIEVRGMLTEIPASGAEQLQTRERTGMQH